MLVYGTYCTKTFPKAIWLDVLMVLAETIFYIATNKFLLILIY